VKILLKYGPNVNFYARFGGTALEKAKENGHTDIVKLLLDNGAVEK